MAYEPVPGVYDEIFDPAGQPRPAWASLVESLEGLGAEELARRCESAQRMLRENGVSYNVYDDPRGLHRPWELDPFPIVLGEVEWSVLHDGLAQRAELLELILADLYGPRRLLREGLLPPELVFANPTYLRECAVDPSVKRRWLHLYAADLGRSPDGEWWVLADRTQAPSGMGYVLENRIVLSRSLPEPFRASHVQRLAHFFRCLQDAFHWVAPRPVEEPRVALLTPGPWNETYFEHAYLARYLGATLVEGADLTVRESVLYLKTLGGLERIDVLLRRVDDEFCDPLSLRSDSTLGVAGLLHCVRANQVGVMNALGSGLVESPALLAFLPALSQVLLNSELKLPSVATWWCGEPSALAYVLDHLDSLVLKPTFPGPQREPVFAGSLSKARRAKLVEQLRADPVAYVAQERVSLSSAPVWNDGRLEARHVGLRTYAVARANETWEVMPGGLARAGIARDSLVVSMQRGGCSKDVWIRTAEPPHDLSLLRPAGSAVELKRGGTELPSRVADDLFWLGRYVERVEGITRMLRTIVSQLSGRELGERSDLEPLCAALEEQAPPGIVQGPGTSGLEAGVLELLFESPDGALRTTLRTVHQLAFSLRDQLSLDTWRVLSELSQTLDIPYPSLVSARIALNRMILQLSAWSGLAVESMTRTLGWRFAEMGQRVERASYMTSLLSHALVLSAPTETTRLQMLLDTAESVITYRRRYRGELQVEAVIDLLLNDETNPRSVGFQLRALYDHVRHLPGSTDGAPPRIEERIALSLLARLRLADVHELSRVEAGKRLALEDVLARTSEELPAVSDALSRSYLSHSGEVRRTERF